MLPGVVLSQPLQHKNYHLFFLQCTSSIKLIMLISTECSKLGSMNLNLSINCSKHQTIANYLDLKSKLSSMPFLIINIMQELYSALIHILVFLFRIINFIIISQGRTFPTYQSQSPLELGK